MTNPTTKQQQQEAREIGPCSICRNATDIACSDCRINDGSVVYVCHKNVCQREHEAAKRHVTNQLFNRMDQIANDVCLHLLSNKNADAKAIIIRELKATVEAALSARDTEVREVLEGLATGESDGLRCWCVDPLQDFHDIRCLAARTLWEQVQE